MLSRLEIEAYYIKIIGVTLVMTASCVSDAGANQLTYEDIFRLVEGREIVLTDEDERSELLSERNQLIYFSQLSEDDEASSVFSQMLVNWQKETQSSPFVTHLSIDRYVWKACMSDETVHHFNGSLNTFKWSVAVDTNVRPLFVPLAETFIADFNGTLADTRAGPVSFLS